MSTMQEIIPEWHGKGSRQGILLEQGLWSDRRGYSPLPGLQYGWIG